MPDINKKNLDRRDGLSVSQYAKKLAEENRLAGGRKIRNLKTCATLGLPLAKCPRIDRKSEDES